MRVMDCGLSTSATTYSRSSRSQSTRTKLSPRSTQLRFHERLARGLGRRVAELGRDLGVRRIIDEAHGEQRAPARVEAVKHFAQHLGLLGELRRQRRRRQPGVRARCQHRFVARLAPHVAPVRFVMAHRVHQAMAHHRAQVGDERVLVGEVAR